MALTYRRQSQEEENLHLHKYKYATYKWKSKGKDKINGFSKMFDLFLWVGVKSLNLNEVLHHQPLLEFLY